MNVQSLIETLYNRTGKKTFMNPYTDINDTATFDITTPGAISCLQFLNEGYMRVCNYEDPRTHEIMQFPERSVRTNFKTIVLTGTCQAGSAAGTIVLPVGFSAIDDFYNDWLVVITGGTGEGQLGFLVDYDGATVTGSIVNDWAVVPDNTSTVKVIKNFYKFVDIADNTASVNIPLDPVDQIYTVQNIFSLTESRILANENKFTNYINNLTSKGNPSTYYFRGNTVYFDVAVDTATWYRIEYLKALPELTTVNEEPLIPSSFHMAVVYWAVWAVIKGGLESDLAWAAKRDFEDIMRSTMQPLDLSNQRSDSQVILEDGENY